MQALLRRCGPFVFAATTQQRCASSLGFQPRYIPSLLDDVEHVEEYHPGGFHPLQIGDLYSDDRYKIIHKLGFGGSSTIWLARDSSQGKLVTLKAMRADMSNKPTEEMPEIAIAQKLHAALLPSSSIDLQIIENHFTVIGPNGTHRFLVSPLAGPSVSAMADCPGRASGSRKLRGDLARKIASQIAISVKHMHGAGFVHGDITTSNILFRVSNRVLEWSENQVSSTFGHPETDSVRMRNNNALDSHAPKELVAPIDHLKLSSYVEESAMLIDFGQSHELASPHLGYEPGTAMHYISPEARFETRAGKEADVWALGCAIFEIRAGSPLFESFFASDSNILKHTVETLGRLPDPWWNLFVERTRWFEEDGTLKSEKAQEAAGSHIMASKSSIVEKLRSIGKDDEPPTSNEGPLIEKTGVTLTQDEVELLADLLGKMLKYRPDERITIEEVVAHPWFAM
ncbi:kinase-like protein [Trametopsis cervina]|nr:kinase-like protein [Trametopsis cervina]